jgi:hypothetical protein
MFSNPAILIARRISASIASHELNRTRAEKLSRPEIILGLPLLLSQKLIELLFQRFLYW